MQRLFIFLTTIILLGFWTMTAMANDTARYKANLNNLQQLNRNLFYALADKDISSVATLLDQGASSNISLNQVGLKTKDVFEGHQIRLKEAKVNPDSWPILTWAVYLGDMESTKLLIRYGANINAPDINGATPIHWATWGGEHTIAKFLMDNGASCGIRDRKNNTAVDWAVMTAQKDLLRLFQNRGCSNLRDQDGDGVPDDRDMCPETPFGAPVDERGCWIGAHASFFDFDKAIVKKEYLPYIVQAAQLIKSYPGLTVRVEGHTDHVGTIEYNINLGLRRATAVKAILVRNGVEASRINVTSKGKSEPVADNTTLLGRAKNRRVEIHNSKGGTLSQEQIAPTTSNTP